ncbi:MAG TPA: L-rhamnose mutarotase [Bacteroidetes bacterium]|nr:L-rhamnose mutarotase [Bacteroidota bacterium]
MNRIAFKMYLNKGQKVEYKKRHDEIWPELKKLLKEAGINEYFIFLDEETNTLFAFQKIKEGSNQDLRHSNIMRKWWNFMADIMKVNPDNSPVTKELEEMFYLK